jgi:ribosomal protein S18 acetylase RimI-like enzyme
MMLINPYNAKDLPAIVSLSVRAWAPVFESLQNAMDAQVFSHFYPHWQEVQANAVEAACSASDMEVWTARDGDSIVGFVAAKLHHDSGMGEIYMIAVDPEHQGMGIGGALTDQAIHWMRESGIAVAMVETGGDPGHAPARRIYERLGFQELPVARYFIKL